MNELGPNEQATLVYLILLLIVVGGAMVIGSRRQLNHSLQQIGIWFLIFIGMIGAYSMRGQIETQLFPSRAIVVQNGTVAINRSWDGQFYVETLVNGQLIEFVIDTGASRIVLSKHDAERIGFEIDRLNFSGQASTANGVVATAPVRLDSLVLGQFKDRDIAATVNGGELDTSLLGMTYLSRFSKIEITRNQMLLIRQ